MVHTTYRPFMKQWTYFDRALNEYVYQMPRFYPGQEFNNLTICVSGVGARAGFSAMLTDTLPNLHTIDSGQCFPLYLYDKIEESASKDLFVKSATTHTRRDAITGTGLLHFQQAYPAKGEGNSITKEDLFYYIYGLLHSPDYRSRYADNLGKELPRIPAVKTYKDFRAFSQAGRDLAHWHLNYETVAMNEEVIVDAGKHKEGGHSCPPDANVATGVSPLLMYRVTKMKFAKTKDPDTGKSINDKTTVIYNERITLKNIPLAAYDYIVNGKPALEWVMERQAVTTDKDSGITNDANLWATETMGDAKYPLELFLRVVTVSLETMKVVNGLPGLDMK